MAKSDWKTCSSDLLGEYVKRGWIKKFQFSLEGWNHSNYTIWRSSKAPDGNHALYHCIFTCPVHGTHFPCGWLKKCQAKQIDGTIWYSMLNLLSLHLATLYVTLNDFAHTQNLSGGHCKQQLPGQSIAWTETRIQWQVDVLTIQARCHPALSSLRCHIQ